MEKEHAALAVLSATVIALVIAVVILSTRISIPAHGRIKSVNIGVYVDANCTLVATEIDWGLIPPSGSSEAQLYMRNEGNAVLNMSFSTDNWLPQQTAQYMTLTWDLANTTLLPSEVQGFVFTLSVASEISGVDSFSFDIIIEGIERE